MAAPDALYAGLTALLAAATDALGAPNAPARRFVSASDPPIECPMLAVFVNGMGIATSGNQESASRSAGRRRAVSYEVEMHVLLTRCAPQPDESGSSPSEAVLNAFAEAMLIDLLELYSGLRHRMTAGTLFGRCTSKRLGDATPIGESGGYAGWRIPVLVDVDGLTP